MSLACDKCGTSSFSVGGRAFSLGFVYTHFRLIMCSACAGRRQVDVIAAICCYNCRSTDILPVDDRTVDLISRADGAEFPQALSGIVREQSQSVRSITRERRIFCLSILSNEESFHE